MAGAVPFLILNFANIAAASHIFLNDAFMGVSLFVIIDRYQQDIPSIAFDPIGILLFLDLLDRSFGGLIPLQFDQKRGPVRISQRQVDYVREASAARQLPDWFHVMRLCAGICCVDRAS